MEITLLIKSIVGLIIFLAILLYFLLVPSRKHKKKSVKKAHVHRDESGAMKTDKESLRAIIKNKTTNAKDLAHALDLILKHHGRIHTKLGERPHPEFDYYMDILFTICRHKNTNKDIIIAFDKRLGQLNPNYKKDINEAIAKGLNSRGV